MKEQSYRKSGFTLIELLVVIAIIGLLSSILLASMTAARLKGQDSRRLSDSRQLKNAMELYYSSNGFYPSIGNNNAGYNVSGLSVPLSGILSTIPSDPTGNSYQYVRGATTSASFALRIRLSSGTWCKTGMNVNPAWWENPATPGIDTPPCSF